MKSIDDTLKIIRDITNAIPVKFDIALVGGVAGILHGVERTTIDVDFCIYSDAGSASFFDILSKHLPKRFSSRLVLGSKVPDDPLKHDIIFIDDTEGEYERIDLLIAHYKWEREGIERAVHIGEVPFPVLSKPYLVAMKLQATGYKDAHDVVTLFGLMSDQEKNQPVKLPRESEETRSLSAFFLRCRKRKCGKIRRSIFLRNLRLKFVGWVKRSATQRQLSGFASLYPTYY